MASRSKLSPQGGRSKFRFEPPCDHSRLSANRKLSRNRQSPAKYAVPLFFIAAPTVSAEFLSYTVSFGTSGTVCCAPMPGAGREPYQSILRVKYMAAATARKLAIAPTSSALSSSRSSR